MTRLRAHITTLFAISQLYHPQPQLNLPLRLGPRPTMAFAIPELLKGGDFDERIIGKMRGMEPDVCLAVTRKGGVVVQVPRIYAVR